MKPIFTGLLLIFIGYRSFGQLQLADSIYISKDNLLKKEKDVIQTHTLVKSVFMPGVKTGIKSLLH